MNILVIGGTVFLGRHFAEAAMARGHRVTLFHRGSKGPGIIPGAEEIFGDRDGGLDALDGREWDAVVDTCGYVPRIVRQSVERVASRVGRYLFVSTISVYSLEGQHSLDESSPVEVLEDPTTEDILPNYGGLKFLCEQSVNEVYGDRSLIVRPGLIAGPYDPSNRFTYWTTRFADGGQVLVPNRPEQPSQLIDVRDLAEFMVLGLEQNLSETYNACGPEAPKTMADMISACHALNPAAEIVWADPQWLVDNGIELWQELPLFLSPDGSADALDRTDNTRAVNAGLQFRPWPQMAAETLAWRQATPAEGPPRHGLDQEKERKAVESWLRR